MFYRVEYLSKFSPSVTSPSASFAGALVERMAGRILVFFVRHASLLRPLSQAGKVQLAKVGTPHQLHQDSSCAKPAASWKSITCGLQPREV